MVLNSPVILLVAGSLSILGFIFLIQFLRKYFIGFENLAVSQHKVKPEDSIGSKRFRSLVLQTIAAPLVVCSILVVTFLYQANSILNANTWVAHTDEVLLKASTLTRAIIEAESNLRGYIIVNEEQFRQQYEESKHRTPALMDALEAMVSDNERQAEKINEIRRSFKDWIESAEFAHQQRLAGKPPTPESIKVRRAIMDKVKTNLEDFDATETNLRSERLEGVRSSVNFSIVVIIFASFIAGIVLALSGGHQLRKLSSNYSKLLSDLDSANLSLEAKVHDRTLELTATNKELEAFCYSVSHDLRAPLRGIDGFSQILIEEYQSKMDEAGVKYLNYIRQGVQKMGVLIDDLLNLSRLTRIEINFKEFDLVPMVEELVNALKAIEPDRKVEFKSIASAPITADPGLIRVALENLLSNAFKYSSKKDVTKIEFGTTETSHEFTYFIRDNGVGFDMKYYGKLFNVFQRLHDNAIYKGTGIGLATVKRVLARHGGEIWAESVPDQQTTFFFTIKRKV